MQKSLPNISPALKAIMIASATGVVLPVNLNLSLGPIDIVTNFDDGRRYDYRINIIRSRIFVDFSSNSDIDPPSLRNQLFTMVGNIVNAVSMQLVQGLSYELETISFPETREVFVPDVYGYVFDDTSEFGERLTFVRNIQSRFQIDDRIMLNDFIARANFELRNSIRYPDFTPLHCRLAIEAIRNAFDSINETQGWDLLRRNLNVDRHTIDSFRDAANDQRHGRQHFQTWAQRRHCMQIAWEICHRYGVWYLQNEPRQALAEAAYPIL